MAGMLEKDVRLVGDAARGNGESLMMLGVRAYWDYDMIGGVQTVEEAQLAIDAAAVCENGAQADSAGDFYRFELQSEKADGFYAYSAMCRLEEALSDDGEAQMNLADKYAFGKGLSQNDEKACFWTQAAAAAGNEEAAAMMGNFWQVGDVLPVSAAMAAKYRQAVPKSSDEVKAVRKALIEKEAAETYAEAAHKSRKVTKRFHIQNLCKTPAAAVLNPILNLIAKLSGTLLTVYIVASVLVFLVNFFAGYHESGLFHYVNEAHAFLLGIPVRALLTLMTDYGFGEITSAVMCEWFCFNGNLIVGAFALLFSGAVAGAWLALCGGAYTVLLTVLGLVYRQGLKITPQKKAADMKRRAAACSDEAYRAILYHRPELQKYSACQLMAICAVADFYGASIASSAKYFDTILLSKEERSLPIVFTYGEKQYNSAMGLYFILHRHLGVSYIPGEKHAFDPKSAFMCGYKEYRQGKNYKQAERTLQGVIESSEASAKEKAWAKHIISLMCFDEFLHHNEDDETMKRADTATIQRGEKLRKEAGKNCILANCSTEALIANAWEGDAIALQAIAHLIDIPEITKYLDWCILNTEGKRHYCGDPCNRDEWHIGILWTDDHKLYKYETKCLRQQLKQMIDELEKLCGKYEKRGTDRATCEAFEKELKKLRKDAQTILDKGYAPASLPIREINKLIEILDGIILEHIQQSIYEDRMRQAREDAINRKLAQFDERMDERERNINMLVYDDFSTNFERHHIMGQMSGKSFYESDYARHLEREKYRRELESAQDEY